MAISLHAFEQACNQRAATGWQAAGVHKPSAEATRRAQQNSSGDKQLCCLCSYTIASLHKPLVVLSSRGAARIVKPNAVRYHLSVLQPPRCKPCLLVHIIPSPAKSRHHLGTY